MASMHVRQDASSRPAALVRLDGEFDLALRVELAWRLDQAIEYDDVGLDARGVTFIDAGCLRLIELARQRLIARGGRFAVIGSSPAFGLVADLAGYPELARTHPWPPVGHHVLEHVIRVRDRWTVPDILEGPWTDD